MSADALCQKLSEIGISLDVQSAQQLFYHSASGSPMRRSQDTPQRFPDTANSLQNALLELLTKFDNVSTFEELALEILSLPSKRGNAIRSILHIAEEVLQTDVIELHLVPWDEIIVLDPSMSLGNEKSELAFVIGHELGENWKKTKGQKKVDFADSVSSQSSSSINLESAIQSDVTYDTSARKRSDFVMRLLSVPSDVAAQQLGNDIKSIVVNGQAAVGILRGTRKATGNSFTKHDLSLLKFFSCLLSVVLRKSWDRMQLREREKSARMLIMIRDAVNVDVQRAVLEMERVIAQLMKVDECLIYFMEPASGQGKKTDTMTLCRGAADGKNYEKTSASRGVAGEVCRSMKMMIVPDVSREPLYDKMLDINDEKLMGKNEGSMLSILSLPVIDIDGTLRGVLQLGKVMPRRKQPAIAPYSEEAIFIMREVASHVAIVLRQCFDQLETDKLLMMQDSALFSASSSASKGLQADRELSRIIKTNPQLASTLWMISEEKGALRSIIETNWGSNPRNIRARANGEILKPPPVDETCTSCLYLQEENSILKQRIQQLQTALQQEIDKQQAGIVGTGKNVISEVTRSLQMRIQATDVQLAEALTELREKSRELEDLRQKKESASELRRQIEELEEETNGLRQILTSLKKEGEQSRRREQELMQQVEDIKLMLMEEQGVSNALNEQLQTANANSIKFRNEMDEMKIKQNEAEKATLALQQMRQLTSACGYLVSNASGTEILRIIGSAAAEMLSCDVRVFVVDFEFGQMYSPSLVRSDGTTQAHAIFTSIERGIAGQCARLGECIRIAQVDADASYDPDVDLAPYRGPSANKSCCLMCTPAIAIEERKQKRVLAVIECMRVSSTENKKPPFSSNEADLLNIFASHVGITLDRMQEVIQAPFQRSAIAAAAASSSSPPNVSSFSFPPSTSSSAAAATTTFQHPKAFWTSPASTRTSAISGPTANFSGFSQDDDGLYNNNITPYASTIIASKSPIKFREGTSFEQTPPPLQQQQQQFQQRQQQQQEFKSQGRRWQTPAWDRNSDDDEDEDDVDVVATHRRSSIGVDNNSSSSSSMNNKRPSVVGLDPVNRFPSTVPSFSNGSRNNSNNNSANINNNNNSEEEDSNEEQQRKRLIEEWRKRREEAKTMLVPQAN